jgi:cell wall-associated NlpC family hydrolase
MSKREAIVVEARRWLGTPWRHQGRVLGVGVDCGGLIVEVGKAVGLLEFDAKPQYGRLPNWGELRQILRDYGEPADNMQKGSILCFAFSGEPQHLGLYTGEGKTLIHAYAQARKVVEHRLDGMWLESLRSVWSYRGLDDDG